MLTAIYQILSTDGRFKDLGDKYVPDRTERMRKDYLKNELRKLGYELSLAKKNE